MDIGVMPRTARIVPEEGVFHILTRGNNRQDIFHYPQDFESYLEILKQVQAKHPFKLYHYCLMTKHVHPLLETTAGNSLAITMKKIFWTIIENVCGYSLSSSQINDFYNAVAGHFPQTLMTSLFAGLFLLAILFEVYVAYYLNSAKIRIFYKK